MENNKTEIDIFSVSGKVEGRKQQWMNGYRIDCLVKPAVHYKIVGRKSVKNSPCKK